MYVYDLFWGNQNPCCQMFFCFFNYYFFIIGLSQEFQFWQVVTRCQTYGTIYLVHAKCGTLILKRKEKRNNVSMLLFSNERGLCFFCCKYLSNCYGIYHLCRKTRWVSSVSTHIKILVSPIWLCVWLDVPELVSERQTRPYLNERVF